MKRYQDLRSHVAELLQLSTRRPLSVDDIDLFKKLVDENPGKRVRVYSDWGFVPNAYRHRCEIQYVEILPGEDEPTLGWGDAHRSSGNGPHATVANRRV